MRCVIAAVVLAVVPSCFANGEDYYPIPLNDAGMDMEFVFPDNSWSRSERPDEKRCSRKALIALPRVPACAMEKGFAHGERDNPKAGIPRPM